MERVVTINLNGNAYQLEEPAYDALRAYLARAEAALASNPDKAEILGDLEQAIADKCAAHLSPAKTVVSAAEMAKALEEMGAVEGDDNVGATQDGASAAPAGAPPKKRLFRLREAGQIAGVCAGLGAYFDISVRLLRFIFLVATVLTWGAFAIVYVALMFLIPTAKSNEDWAAAHGSPYNAQEVIDRVRRAQTFDAEDAWRWSRRWRRVRRAFRDRWSDGYAWRDYAPYPAPPANAPPPSAAGAVFGGVVAVVLGLVHAAFGIAVLCLLYMLVTTGSIGDWRPARDVELWQGTHLSDGVVVWPPVAWWPLIALLIAFSIVLRVLRSAAYGPYPYRSYRAGEGIVALVAIALCAWLAWAYIPDARIAMTNIAGAFVQFAAQVRDAVQRDTP